MNHYILVNKFTAHMQNGCPMLISVIVSTYSPERLGDVKRLITSLEVQNDKGFELVVIVDENQRLCSDIKQTLSNTTIAKWRVVLNCMNNGLAHSRNIGIKKTTGEVVAFIDDDAIADPGWISSIRRVFTNPQVGAATGDIIPRWEKPNMAWFPKELHWIISCSYSITPTRRCHIDRGFGADMAFSREALIRVGSFDERFGINKNRWLGGEDTDLFLRVKDAGYHVIFEPDMRVRHTIYASRITLPKIVNRSVAQGMGSYYIRRYSDVEIPVYSSQEYLFKLASDFIPRSIRNVFSRRTILTIREISTVSISMISIAAGALLARFTPFIEVPQFERLVANEVTPQGESDCYITDSN